MSKELKQAVKHLRGIIKENPNWSWNYCVSVISKLHNISMGVVMSEYSKAKKENNVTSAVTAKRKIKGPAEAYGNKPPYWIN